MQVAGPTPSPCPDILRLSITVPHRAIATDWAQAAMAFHQWVGDSPICPVSRRRRFMAFLPLLESDGLALLQGELGVQPKTQPPSCFFGKGNLSAGDLDLGLGCL